MSKHQNPGSFSEYSQIRNLPFLVVHIEWFCEWLLWISTHFAVAKVIGIAAAILVFFTGVIQFQQSIESNIENKINVAWSIVGQAASAQFGGALVNEEASSSIPVEEQSSFGKIGNIGLTSALETLYNNGIELENVQLRAAYMAGIDLNAKYHWGLSSNWPFVVEKYTRASLADCNLQSSNMYASKLERVNFSFCELNGINISNSKAVKAEFSYTKLKYADLSSSDFTEAMFDGAHLDFANLSSIKAVKTEFTDALMVGTNLEYVDLSEAIGLTQEQVNQACINEKTSLPSGLVWKFACQYDNNDRLILENEEPKMLER